MASYLLRATHEECCRPTAPHGLPSFSIATPTNTDSSLHRTRNVSVRPPAASTTYVHTPPPYEYLRKVFTTGKPTLHGAGRTLAHAIAGEWALLTAIACPPRAAVHRIRQHRRLSGVLLSTDTRQGHANLGADAGVLAPWLGASSARRQGG